MSLPPPLLDLLTTYSELNSTHITTLSSPPSALEFMRYVALNRPFTVKGGAEDWEAVKKWDVKRLKDVMRGESVNVAVTPFGNADSPTLSPTNELLFVKPLEETQSFSTFLDFVTSQELNPGIPVAEVRYAQTQNDNLRNEYNALFEDVDKDIPWARIALQQEPEAINLWIGNSHSTTALHKDPYENIYVQILGRKHFVLLPPIAYPLICEQELVPATYIRSNNGQFEVVKDIPENGMEAEKVPFATWDPDAGVVGEEEEKAGWEEIAKSIEVRVTLEEGDMLYLPALWYHKVSQSCNEEGVCVAVNYWHDMEFAGSFYPLCNFVRNTVLSAPKNQKGKQGGSEEEESH